MPDCEAVGRQAEVSCLILGEGLAGWSNSLRLLLVWLLLPLMLVRLHLLLSELVFSTGGPCQISQDVADCCRGWGGYCLTPNLGLVFEQIRCADWLRTAQVYTMQTTVRQQAACDETAESLTPLSFPTPLSVQPADRQDQRCMQLLSEVLTLDWVGWTGPATAMLVAQGLGFYSLAHILQGG